MKASFLTLLLPEGRDISDPLPVKSASIERACEAPLVESASRCATRGPVQGFGNARLTYMMEVVVPTSIKMDEYIFT